MQSQVGTASNLAAMGHNPLLAAAFSAQQAAHQAVTHGSSPSGGALSQIHPAFLHPFYQLHPTFGQLRPMLAAAAAAAGGQVGGERPGSGGKSFTIDAILGRDGNIHGSDGTNTTGTGSSTPRAQSAVAAQAHRVSAGGNSRGMGPATAALGVLQHRQHRLQTAGHPYLSTLAQCTNPLGFRSAFSPARDKGERKACLGESSGESDWGKSGKAKRVRTIFTPEQLERLEAEFERQQYMVGTERYYLAASLNLTEAQVKVWFQNRRIKWRKTNLEMQHQKLKSIDLLGSTCVEGDSESEESDLDPADESQISPRSHDNSVFNDNEAPQEGVAVMRMSSLPELQKAEGERDNKENELLFKFNSPHMKQQADICNTDTLQNIPQS